ncbi:hypothetical protein COLO4_05643 [Corchorus olitorius]|uniref:Uncharacterized protein n=1 Tax=Corchorus olitorius TaxID=93759 RepID=A0A1R3KQB7_9ROSI|nr:hypothetical protein COLO4_05643 [Corchorus olitorius]
MTENDVKDQPIMGESKGSMLHGVEDECRSAQRMGQSSLWESKVSTSNHVGGQADNSQDEVQMSTCTDLTQAADSTQVSDGHTGEVVESNFTFCTKRKEQVVTDSLNKRTNSKKGRFVVAGINRRLIQLQRTPTVEHVQTIMWSWPF